MPGTVIAAQRDRNRTFVNEFHAHFCSETTGFNVIRTEMGAHGLDKFVEPGLCISRITRECESRAVAFSCVGVEGELGDEQDAASGVLD